MENNIESTTNATEETANSPVDNGVDNSSRSLNEDDFAKMLSADMPLITKASKGGKKIPFPFEQAEPEASSESVEPDAVEGELDLSLLDSDSDNTDTKVEADETSEPESEFEIQVDGQKVKVKQSDLIADAQKWRASNDKFQEASKMRKEADELMSAYKTERETLAGLINQYQNIINQSYAAQEPDWQGLFDTNPAEYIRQKEIWNARMQQVQTAKQHQEQIKAQQEAERKAFEQEYIESQRKLLYEKFPTWKDEAVREKGAKEVISYLISEGFSQDDTNALTDVRLLQVAHKAAMYDKLVKANAAKQVKNQAPKQTLKAGAAVNRDPGFAQRQAQTQAARDAKAAKDNLRSNPTRQGLEDFILSQLRKK
jgi:hypothetical protein